jgi:apolipoprotein N-acyltransferase
MVQVASFVSLVSGAALLALTHRAVVPPLPWLALLFLLHASRSVETLAAGAAFCAALYASLLVGYRRTLPASGAAYWGIVAFVAATTSVPFALDRFASERAGALGVFVFPVALVAVEFFRSPVMATWGSIAYTQFGVMPLMQLAAVTGIWGVTFVVAWFASAAELVWRHGSESSTTVQPLAAFAAATGAIVIAGSIRLARAPTNRPSLRVATINRPLDLFEPGEMTRIAEGCVSTVERPALEGKLQRLHDGFLERSRREARAGARLIVWPEQNLLVFKDEEASFFELARQLAAEERVYLAMGMGTIYPGARLPFENKLVIVDPGGRIVMSYVKEHPVMGWEASVMRVGRGGVQTVPTGDGRIAGAICYDADFPAFIRRAGAAGVDLFVLPVNEWRSIKDVHLHMHVFRAIENGMPIVRAAAVGLSAAVDPWGRLLAVSDHHAPGDTTLVAQLPVGQVRTLYARVGDLFAWACVALLALILAGVCCRGIVADGTRVARTPWTSIAATWCRPFSSTSTISWRVTPWP